MRVPAEIHIRDVRLVAEILQLPKASRTRKTLLKHLYRIGAVFGEDMEEKRIEREKETAGVVFPFLTPTLDKIILLYYS